MTRRLLFPLVLVALGASACNESVAGSDTMSAESEIGYTVDDRFTRIDGITIPEIAARHAALLKQPLAECFEPIPQATVLDWDTYRETGYGSCAYDARVTMQFMLADLGGGPIPLDRLPHEIEGWSKQRLEASLADNTAYLDKDGFFDYRRHINNGTFQTAIDALRAEKVAAAVAPLSTIADDWQKVTQNRMFSPLKVGGTELLMEAQIRQIDGDLRDTEYAQVDLVQEGDDAVRRFGETGRLTERPGWRELQTTLTGDAIRYQWLFQRSSPDAWSYYLLVLDEKNQLWGGGARP